MSGTVIVALVLALIVGAATTYMAYGVMFAITFGKDTHAIVVFLPALIIGAIFAFGTWEAVFWLTHTTFSTTTK